MKRRKIKDTKENREHLNALGITYIINEKKKSLFVKLSSSDFSIVRDIIGEWK